MLRVDQGEQSRQVRGVIVVQLPGRLGGLRQHAVMAEEFHDGLAAVVLVASGNHLQGFGLERFPHLLVIPQP